MAVDRSIDDMEYQRAEVTVLDKENACARALSLMADRAPDATVCPSEVAKALAAAEKAKGGEPDWRTAMPTVHAAVDELVAEGAVALTWKGRRLLKRAGPYRIGRALDE
jgi:hypothetical protein